MKKWYSLMLAHGSTDTLECEIYEEIGGFFGMSAKAFIKDIKLAGKDVKNISLSINSPGGNVFDGLAIYNYLKASGKTITCRVDGVCASMASIIAMAADTITMPENSFMMIHNPWGIVDGDADDLRSQADILDKLTTACARIYSDRSGKTVDECKQLMNAETWMDGNEAVEMGFANEVTEAMDVAAVARHDFAAFGKVPREIVNMKKKDGFKAEDKPEEKKMEEQPADDKKAADPKEEPKAAATGMTQCASEGCKNHIEGGTCSLGEIKIAGTGMCEERDEGEKAEDKPEDEKKAADEKPCDEEKPPEGNARKEFKAMCDLMGNEKAAKYFAAGKSLEQAKADCIRELRAEVGNSNKRISDLEKDAAEASGLPRLPFSGSTATPKAGSGKMRVSEQDFEAYCKLNRVSGKAKEDLQTKMCGPVVAVEKDEDED